MFSYVEEHFGEMKSIIVLLIWLSAASAFLRAPAARSMVNARSRWLGATEFGEERTGTAPTENNKEAEKLFADFVGIGNNGDSLLSPSNDGEEDSRDKPSGMDQWIARGMLLLVAAVYGTNFSCVKLLGEQLDPSVASLLRFTIAGLVFSPYMVDNFKKNPKLIMGGVEVGIYSALGYYGQAVSLHTTPASTAAFICSLAVIVVPMLDMMFPEMSHGGGGKAKSNHAAMIPAVLAALGVAFLELGGEGSPGSGDLWALAQPVFFGLGFWRVESFMSETEDGEPQAFTGAMMSTVAFASFLWAVKDCFLPAYDSGGLQGLEAVINSQFSASVTDWHVALALLWTGIVTTALTSYGENYAMKTLSSAETTVIFSTEPLWGTAFAAYAFNEAVGANTFIGAFFILVACVYSSIGPAITLPTLLSTGQLISGGLLFEEETGGILENISANLNKLVDDAFGGAL